MSMIRKSAVSTKSSWFKKNSVAPLAPQRSQGLSTNKPDTFTPSNKSPVVRPRRKRNSTDQLSSAVVNQAVLPNLGQDTHPPAITNAQQKSSGSGYLPMMSQTGATPGWLLRLHYLYRYSSGIAFCLVTATLAVYGWTVYSQELWGKYYSTLKNLQRHERQLNTTNAALTSKMAKEGEAAGKALISPTAGKTIFLQSTYQGSESSSSTTSSNPATQIPTSSSLGY
ncbi:hypothetical protein WJM97_00325 [Okeanomitos corallinicola TIOX110]|uniref:Cell division protein FtsL n=1 Tax=Okeanomitos corallinicola TIOX110 TaxID=3133117 RepID=A0ABZ2US13_9CYAN